MGDERHRKSYSSVEDNTHLSVTDGLGKYRGIGVFVTKGISACNQIK